MMDEQEAVTRKQRNYRECNFMCFMETWLHERQPVSVRTVKKWSPEAMESLQRALEAADWNALSKPHSKDIDGLTVCTSKYIGFCMDNFIPPKRSTAITTTILGLSITCI